MTTSRSPLSKIKPQADKIALTLKAVSDGKKVANDPSGKIAASLAKGEVKFGIVQDDKIITVTMPWQTIRESSEAQISEWIIAYMRGETEN